MSAPALTATYTSPTTTKTFTSPLRALPTDPKALTVKDKTAYLSALRARIVELQGDVNAFLTMEMEADKVVGDGMAKGQGKGKEEEREEEMYGEEDGEE